LEEGEEDKEEERKNWSGEWKKILSQEIPLFINLAHKETGKFTFVVPRHDIIWEILR
jgi:hypothetical protein